MTYDTSVSPAFIGISGIIGVGKSTLTKALSKRLGIPAHYEPVEDNEYLKDFYKDPARYSFSMQIYLLSRRFEQHQRIIWSGLGGIQDRTIYEDTVFASMLKKDGLMSERDYECYARLFKNMANFMCKPSLIIHLDAAPEEAISRARQRNREAESTLSLEYMTKLYNEYQVFINEISESIKVIRVNWGISSLETTDTVADKILKALDQKTLNNMVK